MGPNVRRGSIVAQAALLLGLVSAASLAEGQQLVWMWAGALTESSVSVKARVDASAGPIRLLVWPAEGRQAEGSVVSHDPAERAGDGVVSFVVRDLEPATSYRYAIEIDGRRDGETGGFMTLGRGPMSFRLAFGSCASTGSNHHVFDAIRSLEPILFVHMGDLHYENIGENDPQAFRRAYEEVLTAPRQAALYRSTPVAYVWDDHDYGPDDSDTRSPSRPAALAAYRSIVPHYPLTLVEGRLETIHQSFRIGRVRFLLTDSRARRDPVERPDGPGKSMLGAAQRRWLFGELEAAAESDGLLVWINPVPWITRAEPGSEQGWEPYSWERRLIAERIAALGLEERMLMLSGDAHMVAIDDGTNSNYASDASAGEPGFPVMQAAPLDRHPSAKGGPYSHGSVMPRWLFGAIKIQQFGVMDLHDDGEAIEVLLTGRDEDGGLLDGMQLELRCEPRCRVVGGGDERPEHP